MNIVRLTYVSRLAKNCGADALGKIVAASRRNNEKHGITGALCYSPRGFLQILEGPPEAVNELYRRIVQDRRNTGVTLLEYTKVPSREFEHWSMAYVRTDELSSALLQKYSTHRLFDPFTMGPVQARVFLLAVVQLSEHHRALESTARRQRKS